MEHLPAQTAPQSETLRASRRPALIRISASAVVAILALAAGMLYVGRSEIRDWMQRRELARYEARVRAFEERMGRLLSENRRAVFTITEQHVEQGTRINTVSWTEFDSQGTPLMQREFALPGRELYVDAVVVEYEYQTVEAGEKHNFSIFRRLFTDEIRPLDGVPLYPVTLEEVDRTSLESLPPEERAGMEEQLALLERYLDNPRFARENNVRVVEGEARYVRMKPGVRYLVQQRAAGGMIITEEEE